LLGRDGGLLGGGQFKEHVCHMGSIALVGVFLVMRIESILFICFG
jgi:hypothetical protein